jgi:hypothetical protein
MKLWTSCFWTHMTAPQTVSIAWKTPRFYKGPSYTPLAPPAELVLAYKDGGMPWDVYEAIYRGEVLSKLTPAIIEADLLDGTVLLCWERNGNCHRHVVAAWLRENGIDCAEVDFA